MKADVKAWGRAFDARDMVKKLTLEAQHESDAKLLGMLASAMFYGGNQERMALVEFLESRKPAETTEA